MTYDTINLTNSSGIDDIMVYAATVVPAFIPAMLVFLWVTFTLIIYFGTRKFSGNADIFAAASSAGFFTVLLSMTLQFSLGLITAYTLGTTIAILIISFIAMMPKRNRD